MSDPCTIVSANGISTSPKSVAHNPTRASRYNFFSSSSSGNAEFCSHKAAFRSCAEPLFSLLLGPCFHIWSVGMLLGTTCRAASRKVQSCEPKQTTGPEHGLGRCRACRCLYPARNSLQSCKASRGQHGQKPAANAQGPCHGNSFSKQPLKLP